jgi:adenosylcobinamide-GDP ribazoletransferase
MMTISEPWLADRTDELKASVTFLTRIPLSREAPGVGFDIARTAWAFPLVGMVVGLIGAAVYALAHALGLPAWPASTLSVAATLWATGCLHEDGLADTADGFGGGKTRERKLDIMRDSRIGTYGVCALAIAILLRVSVLAALAGPATVALVLIMTHGAARAVLPMFMSLVPAARRDGLSHDAGQPPSLSVAIAAALGALLLVAGLGLLPGIGAVILLAIAAFLMAWLCEAQIGGQTGDVLGALEQVCEIVIFLVALH